MTTIYRYIQLGVHVRARYDKKSGKFMREVCEVTEFFVTNDNVPDFNVIYRKNIDGTVIMNGPSEYLLDYLESQGVDLKEIQKDWQNENDKPFDDDKKEDNNLSSDANKTSLPVNQTANTAVLEEDANFYAPNSSSSNNFSINANDLSNNDDLEKTQVLDLSDDLASYQNIYADNGIETI